ncbi:MAG: L-methionine (R)-S-oxide reductase [Sphingobacteriales bacterium]|jgi:L-methionine (R)-S-oxide reductase
MAENLVVSALADKETKYRELIPQLKALVEGEEDFIANVSNILAALKQTFNWLWVGIYIVKNEELVLGPFQGPVACTRIQLGRGVCGKAWQDAETIIVPNVDEFPGHIACSSDSKSEIVVPILKKNKVVAILDVDHSKLNHFDECDKIMLEQICLLISDCLKE